MGCSQSKQNTKPQQPAPAPAPAAKPVVVASVSPARAKAKAVPYSAPGSPALSGASTPVSSEAAVVALRSLTASPQASRRSSMRAESLHTVASVVPKEKPAVVRRERLSSRLSSRDLGCTPLVLREASLGTREPSPAIPHFECNEPFAAPDLSDELRAAIGEDTTPTVVPGEPTAEPFSDSCPATVPVSAVATRPESPAEVEALTVVLPQETEAPKAARFQMTRSRRSAQRARKAAKKTAKKAKEAAAAAAKAAAEAERKAREEELRKVREEEARKHQEALEAQKQQKQRKGLSVKTDANANVPQEGKKRAFKDLSVATTAASAAKQKAKKVHVVEPAAPSHKGKGKKGKKQSDRVKRAAGRHIANVQSDMYLQQCAAFQRLLTHASRLEEQLNC